MEAFLGSWKMVSKSNLNDFMEAFDCEGHVIDYINNAGVVITYSQDEDKIVLKSKMYGITNNSVTLSFKLGEEFDEVSVDFRSCKTVFNLEEGKLVKLQKWDGKETKTISEIQDGKLIQSLTFEDVVSVLTYERV